MEERRGERGRGGGEEDLWEDAELAGEHWPHQEAVCPAVTPCGLHGGSVRVVLEADGAAAGSAPPPASTAPQLPAILSREQEAEEQARQKSEQQAERERALKRRQQREAAHRLGLLYWPGHGCALSMQASDVLLQAQLISMLPPHLLARTAPDAMSKGALRTLLLWLPTAIGEPSAPLQPSAPGSSDEDGPSGAVAREALKLTERRWLLLMLLREAQERAGADWAVAAAGGAVEELNRLAPVAAGAATGFEPVSARGTGTSELLQQLAQEVHEASLLRQPAYGGSNAGSDGNISGTLVDALATGESTATQHLLFLIALLRARGLVARLVVALQPPLCKLPAQSRARGGVKSADGSRATARAPHTIPCWGEVHMPQEGRWVAFDPFFNPTAARASRVAVDEPEAIVHARLVSRAAHAKAYIVGFGASGPATDVTARYVADLQAVLTHRSNAVWWETSLRGAVVPGMESSSLHGATNGEGLEEPIDLCEEGDTRAVAAAAEEAEVRSRLASRPIPTSLAAFKKDPSYVLEKDIGRYEALHPADTPLVGLFKGHKVFPRSAVKRVMTSERWFRECRCIAPAEAPYKTLAKGSIAPGRGRPAKRPLSAIEAAASAADADFVVTRDDDEALDEQIELYGEWQTYPYEAPAAIGGIVPRSARGHVEMWTEAHKPLGTVWLKVDHALTVAKKLGIDAAPAMVGFDMRDGRSVPRFDGVIVCEDMAPVVAEAAAAMAEQEEDKRMRKRRKYALGLWANLLQHLSVRERLEAEYVRSEG